MIRFLMMRLRMLPALLLVVTLVGFALVEFVPGDPVDFMIGENASLDQKTALRAAYHLDDPWPIRFVRFHRDLARGELRSLHSREPVIGLLLGRLPYTLALAAAALVLSLSIAIPLGTLAAYRAGTWIDAGARLVALGGISMPSFSLGPLLIVLFAIHLRWLPVSGAEEPASIVLPAVCLGVGMSGILARVTRASVLETLGSDFVRTARGKGGGPVQVVRHALRAALIPIVSVLGLQLGALLTGAVITEEIFAWPGIGREIVGAVRSRDLPVLQCAVLLLAATWALVNAATDAAYRLLDPRVQDR